MGSGGNGHPFVAPGVAGSAVETVVVRGDGWEVTSPTEARTGGFLIGADLDESIDLAALDASGQELFSITNSTIWVAASELR
jgi:hypothetical protein